MKRFVGVLMFLCAMLLMCSCASAICDIHSNVTYQSSGYNTHTWVCNDCGLSGEEWHRWGPWIDLGSSHTRTCEACQFQSEPSSHYYYCDGDPTVCQGCDLAGISSDHIQMNHWGGYINLGTQHVSGCSKCGAVDEWAQPRDHYTGCNLDKTVCNGCRVTGLNPDSIKIVHTKGLRFKDLGTQHQQKCSYCDYEFEPEYHYGSCQYPTVCMGCDAPGMNILPEHLRHNYEPVDLGKKHVWECTDCGAWESEPENHTVMCDEWICISGCDLPVTEAEKDCIFHWTKYVTYERSTTEHIQICSSCGRREAPMEHFQECTRLGVCAECRMSSWDDVVISRTVHYANKSTITYTAENHSFDCVDCNKRVTRQPHFYWYSDECEECGYLYGSLPPSPFVPGDASGDGETDIFDALAVLQFAVGWDTELDPEAGDVNDDGMCDIFDALLILQYAVGWDVELK